MHELRRMESAAFCRRRRGYGLRNRERTAGLLQLKFLRCWEVLWGSACAENRQYPERLLKCGAPIVGMNGFRRRADSGGVNALSGYGKIFTIIHNISGVIPQISVIMGPCAGGAVYSPAITDYIFMVRDFESDVYHRSRRYKDGDRRVTAERLGGAVTHNTESGAAHFTDSTDEGLIAHVRELLSYIPSNNAQNPPVYESSDDINRKVPEIAEIVQDMNRAYDMYDVIRAVADDGELFLQMAMGILRKISSPVI